MNRYLLVAAAAAAAASVAVAGPLPDPQWQDQNNELVALVPESPSALNQDAPVQTFPVPDTNWIIAGVPGSEFDEEGYQSSSQNDANFKYHPIREGTDIIYGETPTEDWKLKSFECKAQASVCCSEENHLGPDYIHNPSILKSCAASSFPPPPPQFVCCRLSKLSRAICVTAWANHFTLMFSAGVIESEKLWYAGSELLASDDSRINNYCYKPDYVNGCDVLRNKMAVRKNFTSMGSPIR